MTSDLTHLLKSGSLFPEAVSSATLMYHLWKMTIKKKITVTLENT